MSKITLTGNDSGTGVITIQSPNSNSNRTIAIPEGDGAWRTLGEKDSVIDIYDLKWKTIWSKTGWGFSSFWSKTFTPASSSSRFVIMWNIWASSNQWAPYLNLYRNTNTVLGHGTASGHLTVTDIAIYNKDAMNTHGKVLNMTGIYIDSPATSSNVTYDMRASGRSNEPNGTTYINRSVSDRTQVEYDYRYESRITVMELSS